MMSSSIFTRLRLAIVSVICSVFLIGCQSVGGGSGVDPRLTAGDTAQFFSKSGLQACALGAGAGILACAVSNAGNKAACMAIAAVAGCGIGAGGNYLLDSRRAKYSNQEQLIGSFIADVQADNDSLKKRIAVTSVVMQENKQTLIALQQKIASKQIDAKGVASQLDGINANKAYLETELKNINARIDGFQDLINQERIKSSSKSIASLTAELKKYEAVRDQYLKEQNDTYALTAALTQQSKG
jgi:hypothetical protein